jgi:hypothetical protein
MSIFCKSLVLILNALFIVEAYAISFEKVNLSDSLSFKDVLWIDADGNGVEDAVGIEANDHNLVARLRAGRNQAPSHPH